MIGSSKSVFWTANIESADKKDRVLQGPHAQIKEINSVAKNVLIINMV
jgi:hypothetical protein